MVEVVNVYIVNAVEIVAVVDVLEVCVAEIKVDVDILNVADEVEVTYVV